jgi:hypothetical protein
MTNQPKLWKDMTDAEKGALLLADQRGEEIQGTVPNGGGHNWVSWTECQRPCWDDGTAYRVKPKAPKVETVEHECHVWKRTGGSLAHYDGHDYGDTDQNITHTYTITDGRVTACDTIIHDNKEK